MGRDGRPNEPASAMAKHQEPEELLKRHPGDHKEINRRDPLRMIAKEGFPGNGRPCLGTMYFDTVDWATSMPSLSNSPWILGAPQSGFSKLIRRIRSRICLSTHGRPPSGRDFHRQ
jgi:hypothetical protein